MNTCCYRVRGRSTCVEPCCVYTHTCTLYTGLIKRQIVAQAPDGWFIPLCVCVNSEESQGMAVDHCRNSEEEPRQMPEKMCSTIQTITSTTAPRCRWGGRREERGRKSIGEPLNHCLALEMGQVCVVSWQTLCDVFSLLHIFLFTECIVFFF